MTGAPEKQITTGTEETQKQPEQAVKAKPSSRKTIVAFATLALAINGTAAVYTLPSHDGISIPNWPLPNLSTVAELFSREPVSISVPIPEAVTTALTDIQSSQQLTVAAVHENESSLQQNAVLLRQGITSLDSLKQGMSTQQTDVKKISAQLTALTAKVDALQSAMSPDITSSIPRGRARNRLMAHKRIARSSKPVGPVSVGGAPLTTTPWAPPQSPEG
jgi:cell division protein FtsB